MEKVPVSQLSVGEIEEQLQVRVPRQTVEFAIGRYASAIHLDDIMQLRYLS